MDSSVLGLTPAWSVDVATTYLECSVVVFTGTPAIEFNIEVNNTVIATINMTTLVHEQFAISVPVVVNDRIRINLIDVGAGTNTDMSVVLRPFTT